GSCNPPRSFGDLNGFGEDRFVWSGSRTEWLQDRRETLLAMAGEANNKGKRYVRESMLNISASVEAIQNATAGNLPYSFPNTSLGRACRDVAKVIRAGNTLGTQFFFLDRGGFDTHSDQNGTLNNNLSDIDASIGALANAAKGLGVWNRMIIVTMTEFGRTFGNNRAGEDHGDYWSSLVLGGQVNGGRIVNPGPSASEVAAADGFLRGHEIHYGQVFWETIAAMGYDPNQVFPNRNFSSYSLNLFR
ncbi:MAG: DUF1501 domain-containing protein, partial [Bdellovibrionales bacterium]|nr:DUF1501 domain-containing protein [Bdellovibrionales bacterium]